LDNLLSTLSLFVFTHTAPTDISTLSLHDALPIFLRVDAEEDVGGILAWMDVHGRRVLTALFLAVVQVVDQQALSIQLVILDRWRSEEHTSELQSRVDLVCRLLLEKKKNIMSREPE